MKGFMLTLISALPPEVSVPAGLGVMGTDVQKKLCSRYLTVLKRSRP